MNEADKRLWWQAYCAALAGMQSEPGGVNSRIDKHACIAADLAVESYHDACGTEVEPPTGPYEGWAHLEIMGHRSHYGYVREVRSYGAKLVEVKVLDKDGEDFATVHQYGGGAIFSLQMLDEEKCRRGARGEERYQCRHTNDQGDRDCAKMVWSQSVYEAYCEEHKPEESGDDSSNIPW